MEEGIGSEGRADGTSVFASTRGMIIGGVVALKRVGPQLRSAIYDLRLGRERDKPFYELLESLVELQRSMAPDCGWIGASIYPSPA
jgi:hypothetical protein